MKRQVTERDFRMPEFLDAKPEDYEFRDDGKLVRKDRWETGIRSICSAVGMNVRQFEIVDVVNAVKKLCADEDGWCSFENYGYPECSSRVDVRLIDGSRLRKVMYNDSLNKFIWEHGEHEVVLDFVVAWRECNDNA